MTHDHVPDDGTGDLPDNVHILIPRTEDTGYPIELPISSLVDGGRTHDDVLRSTYAHDGWLVQLRVDNKKIVGHRAAANDNQPMLAEANS